MEELTTTSWHSHTDNLIYRHTSQYCVAVFTTIINLFQYNTAL